MSASKELQSTSRCPNGDQYKMVSLLGLVLFNTFINDIAGLSARLWMTPS